jgi:hypothetical protein
MGFASHTAHGTRPSGALTDPRRQLIDPPERDGDENRWDFDTAAPEGPTARLIHGPP